MYVNRTQLDFNIARRNALPSFQLFLTDWAQVSDAEPAGGSTTRITLPSKVLSLFGCSINPNSDISSVTLIPTWNSLIGIDGEIKAGDTLPPPSPIVEVGKPAIRFAPGPISFFATTRTWWNKDDANAWYWSAAAGLGVTFQSPLMGNDPSSTLILDCWIRPLDPGGIPVKRPDLYIAEKRNFVDTEVTDKLLLASRIDGRKKVKLTVKTTALQIDPTVAPVGNLDFRVSLLRPNSDGSTDVVALLTEVQVEPAVAGSFTTLAPGAQFDMEIDQPEATMLIINATTPAINSYQLQLTLQASD